MYTTIRRVKAQPGVFDEVVQQFESGLVPLLRSFPGFIWFDLMQIGEDMGLSIVSFETQEQTEEAHRNIAEWMEQNIVPLVVGPAEVVAVGEMRFRKGKDAE